MIFRVEGNARLLCNLCSSYISPPHDKTTYNTITIKCDCITKREHPGQSKMFINEKKTIGGSFEIPKINKTI